MDLSDQRMACLRMAMELNCKTEPLLQAANELMAFVAHGPAAAAQPAEIQELSAAEPAVDAIAACGTALVMPEGGELALAEVTVAEVTAAAPVDETATESEEAVSEAAPAAQESADPVAEAVPEAEAAAEAAEAAPEAAEEQTAAPDDETASEDVIDVPAHSQAAEAAVEEAAATQH
jgi:hypothetical protein